MKYTEEYIIENADALDWKQVSKEAELHLFSNEFFHRFERDIKWSHFSFGVNLQELNDEFMEKYQNKLDWFVISSQNKTITTEFAHRYRDKIGFLGYYKDGKLHREDGPALLSDRDCFILINRITHFHVLKGTVIWAQKGEIHRENGPAVIHPGEIELNYIHGDNVTHLMPRM